MIARARMSSTVCQLAKKLASCAVDTAADHQAGYAAKSEYHYQHAHMTISCLYDVIIYEDRTCCKDV